ncbi:DUF2079 domain-containing protein [Candidatus Bathyarchaeota archaeon]|nr:DUF2079 domain-containing protein [Candidatus Bathyarchaeota archaeon]
MTQSEKIKMVLVKVERIPKKILKNLRIKSIYDLAIWMPITVYAIVFSYFTILKHYTFNSYAWDLGVFNQALYTTVFYGKPLYYTADLYLNLAGSYLAIHFSPILFLVAPVYALHPTAETLLVIKSSALALGALPLYMLAKEKLEDYKAAFMLAIIYLLYPGLQGANWFDFQQQIFLPLLTFTSLYFMEKRCWKLFFITLALSLMISEHATLTVLGISLYLFLTSDVRMLPASLRKPRLTRGVVSLVAVIMCILSYMLGEYVKASFPIAPEFMEKYKATSAYRVLGFKEGKTILLPIYVLTHPDKAVEALLYDYPRKLLYILLLFGPLAFTPFISKSVVITAILLLPFMVSNYSAYYRIGSHYSLYLLPPIFMATLETLSKSLKKNLMPIMKIMMISSLILIVSTSPISPVSQSLMSLKLLWYPSPPKITERVEVLHEIIDMVPRNASILTQNNIFPHISNRINAYVIPITTFPAKETAILKHYVRSLINISDYILIDANVQNYWTNFLLNEVSRNDSPFEIYVFSTKNIILFKRTPEVNAEKPLSITFAASEDFRINHGIIVEDDTSRSKRIIFYPKESGERIFLYGPYVYLPQGIYNATFLVKVASSEGYIATLDVVDDFGRDLIARKDIYGFEIEPNIWNNITLTFTISTPRTLMEFRVFSNGKADIYVDQVIVKRISGNATMDFRTLTFNYRYLKTNGKLTDEKTLLYSAKNGENKFSIRFNPHVDLKPGKYRLSLILKVDPTPEMEDSILTLNVVGNYGVASVASMEIYGKTFLESEKIGLGWHKVTLEFNVESFIKEVELMGTLSSEKHDVYLAYLLLERAG